MPEKTRDARRPLIVTPARFSPGATALRYEAEVTARALVQAVFAAGGEPVVVHPYAPDLKSDVDAARERIWFADGVLLPGGGDVAARWSGQQPHPTQYGVDEEQDAFDLAVARVALAGHLPLLAICRGTQLVNVALGGDLVQDMDDTVGNHKNRVHDLEVRSVRMHDHGLSSGRKDRLNEGTRGHLGLVPESGRTWREACRNDDQRPTGIAGFLRHSESMSS